MPLSHALFDEGRLDEMIGELGEEPILAVLRKLAAHAQESSDRIAQLHSQGEVAAMRKEAHSLKGAAAMAGAPRLQLLAAEIEKRDTVGTEAIAQLDMCAADIGSYVEERFG